MWWEAARPKTLRAAVSPVLIGIAIAFHYGKVHVLAAILALLGAILIQIGTNFYNDLADFQKGADSETRKGPRRLVQAGMISQQAMRVATALTFGMAVVSGIYLMIRGGYPIVAIGIASFLFGLLYTGGKYSLAYLGIADLFVLAFFGPIAVAGTFYVQALEWPMVVWLAGLSPGLLAVAILLVNNIRDREQDALAGKRTLIVRFGRSVGLRLYSTAFVLCFVVVVVQVALHGLTAFTLLSFLSLPAMVEAARSLGNIPDERSQEMNPILAQTAKNLLLFSILYSVGWIIGGLY